MRSKDRNNRHKPLSRKPAGERGKPAGKRPIKEYERERRPDKHTTPAQAKAGRGLILYGTHAVVAALKNPRRHAKTFYYSANTANFLSEHGLSLSAHVRKQQLDRAGFGDLLGEGAVHQGVALACEPLSPPSFQKLFARATRLVMLDQVTDPHNIGAILRSCTAFGIEGVIVQSRHSPAESGVMAKSACGALDIVPLLPVTNLSRCLVELKELGFTALALDERGTPLGNLPAMADKKWVLVFGAEGDGIRRLVQDTCDQTVSLPMNPAMPSLNVSNAVAVSLYALTNDKK